MKAYILIFITSLFFCILSDFNYNKKKFIFSKMFLMITVIALCLLAAFRTEYVGRDIHNYLTLLFRDFSSGITLLEELKSTRASGIEPLFMLLVLIASKFKSLNVVFFFVQLAITLPIVIFAYNLKKTKNVSISFTIFIFLMTMYAYSFSMMRQSIAISLCLLSLFYFMNDERKKSYVLFIISFFFHRTSIIMIAIYMIYHFVFENERNRFLYLFLTICVCIGVGIFLPVLVSLLPAKYSMYLGANYETSFNFFSLFKKIIFFVPALFFTIGTEDKKSYNYKILLFSTFLFLMDIVFYLFGLRVPEISRMCLYFTDISYFIFLPILCTKIKPKMIGYALVTILMMFFWVHMTTGNNEADIYPYKSDIVPFLND